MKKTLKKFFQNQEDIAAATAFAEAGEFDAAKEILSENRVIVLILTGKETDKESLRYALNACRRLNAAMEILYAPAKDDGNHINQLLMELKNENIPCMIRKVKGCIKEEVLERTRKNADVLFVVVEFSNDLNVYCKDGDVSDIYPGFLNRLGCPLVVVSDKNRVSEAT